MSQVLFQQSVPIKKRGFWVRQFGVKGTAAQDRFDVIFGVVLPIICLIADPVIFQGGFLQDQPYLGEFSLFAYLFSGIQIGIFLGWRAFAKHLTPASGLVGGVLLAGALFSLTIGILILPLTLLGLIVLIGAAGFTPFFTAFVYLRTGVRALKCQEQTIAFESRFLMAVVTGLASIGLPVLVSVRVAMTSSAAMNDLIYGNVRQAELAINRLKWLPVSPSERRQIIRAYELESNVEKKNVLKRYYKNRTGEDIEARIQIMND